jgi:hypothetical protein
VAESKLRANPTPLNELGFDWLQHIGTGAGWTGDIAFGLGDNRSAVVIYRDFGNGWDTLLDAIKGILGWSAKIPGSTQMTRKVPWRNPSIPAHVAFTVPRVEGWKFTGKARNRYGPFPTYKRWRLTIGFQSPPYKVIDDSTLSLLGGGEWQRWTSRTIDPRTRFLTREQGFLAWAEGTPNIGSTPVKGSISVRVETVLFSFKWWYVPTDGLLNASGLPLKIMNCVGKVNSTTFMGFPAGTLLCESPRIEDANLPLVINAGGDPILDAIPYGHHCTMNYLWFDPPRGTISPPVGKTWPDSAMRGHNLLPHPQNKQWYPAFMADGSPLYDEVDFATMWQMN